jgi:hypothetical protein
VLRVQAGAGNGDEVRGSRWWLGKVVARAEEGSRGGEQGRGRGRGTRGSYPSRRWSGGGSTNGGARGALHQRQGGRAEQHVLEEEEERGGVRGAYLEISEISGTSR